MESAAWVGTVGRGLWRSDDLATWTAEPAVPADARILALAAAGDTLLAGGRGCVYRRQAGRWATLPLPGEPGADEIREVWSLAVDPAAPATVLAGCRPFALLRSDDGGERWQPLPLRLPPSTPRPHTPRVTAIVAGTDSLWCGAEVGGVFRSADGGEHWTAVNAGLASLDIHALAGSSSPAAGGASLLAATPQGIARYDGRWSGAALAAPWSYCRALAGLPGRPGQFLCGLGDGPPGTRGGVVVSEDDGRTWRSSRFPGTAASTVWSIAVASDGETALASAIGGELFSTEDAGRTWSRLPRTFDEVRAVWIT